ncbi:type II secretion system F family protein [Candidatus Dojkabacteria bacterium]|nr:type II secretion system F family protein [Candidatus Dojkabacteria bacterium]
MKFSYTASDKNGKLVKAVIEADTRDEVVNTLHAQGLIVMSVEEKIRSSFKDIGQIQISGYGLKDKLMVVKQLVAMITAGLPITQAMDVLKDQAPNPKMKAEIIRVYKDLQNGIPLSKAFSKNSKIFSEVQVNLMAAGEKSGNLVEILGKIQQDMANANRLRNKIRGAMIYPAIIFVAIIAVFVVLVTFLVPQMEKLYADFGIEELPGLTNIIVKVSKFVVSPIGLIVIIVLLIAGISAYYYYNSTESGKRMMHRIILKIPVFGDLNQKIQVAEFARLTSMLLKSGVPIVDTLNIVANSTSNILFKEVVEESAVNVSKGIPLAVSLSKNKIFPPVFSRIVVVGEETGKLDQVLSDMAGFYDEEVTNMADNLTKLLEPFILLVVGGLVAFLAIAVYWPVYSIGDKI